MAVFNIMAEQDLSRGLVVIETIGVEKALEMQRSAVAEAELLRISGYLEICDVLGVRLVARVVRQANLIGCRIAEAKIQTVLSLHQSTSLRRARIEQNNYNVYDFGGMIGSTFGGGVAIFKDRELKTFLGAIAFSGGEPKEDEQICRVAVERVGLYTDV